MNKLPYKLSLSLFSIVNFVILLCFLASCTTTKTYKLYEGQQLPEDKIAHLISKEERILVHSVDGVKSPEGKETYGPSVFELSPGDHTLTVSFRRTFTVTHGRTTITYRSTSSGSLDVKVNAEAGHTYRLGAEHDPEKEQWYAIVMDETKKKRIVEAGPYSSKTVQVYRDVAPFRGG